MHHSFDISIAKKFGINVAVFLNNLAFWIKNNVANKVNFEENTYWTFMSHPAFLVHFPYWSQQTLKTTIKHCLDNDLILISNFNKKKYDKTSWYALTENGLNLFPCLKDDLNNARNEKNSSKINIGENQPMDRLKSTDASVKINRPIQDNKQDNKQDIKALSSNDEKEDLFDCFWNAYPRKENKLQSKKIWDRHKLNNLAELIIEDVIHRSAKNWKGRLKKHIPLPTTYLNGEKWNDELFDNVENNYAKRTETNSERLSRLAQEDIRKGFAIQ